MTNEIHAEELAALVPELRGVTINGRPAMEVVSDRIEAAGWAKRTEGEQVETCHMVHEEPYDFASCETHDTTFALGEKCKFDGRVMWEVYAEEADTQRARAVLAEEEVEQLQASLADEIQACAARVEKAEAEVKRLTDGPEVSLATGRPHPAVAKLRACREQRNLATAEVERLTEQLNRLTANTEASA